MVSDGVGGMEHVEVVVVEHELMAQYFHAEGEETLLSNLVAVACDEMVQLGGDGFAHQQRMDHLDAPLALDQE
jgi:hypothetical protein